MPNSTEEDQWGMENVEFCTSGNTGNLRNGASYALDQYKVLTGNHTW